MTWEVFYKHIKKVSSDRQVCRQSQVSKLRNRLLVFQEQAGSASVNISRECIDYYK